MQAMDTGTTHHNSTSLCCTCSVTTKVVQSPPFLLEFLFEGDRLLSPFLNSVGALISLCLYGFMMPYFFDDNEVCTREQHLGLFEFPTLLIKGIMSNVYASLPNN